MFVDAPGNDDFTKLLLHFDAANGSTSLKDFSAQNHTVTCVGTAAVSTAQSVFGGSSIALGAGGNYITTPDSADWNLGSGNFVTDFRTRHTSIPSGGSPATLDTVFWFQQNVPDNDLVICGLNAAGGVFFNSVDNLVVVGGANSADLGLSINTWYHWAFVRSGASFFIFLNGVSQSLTITTAFATLPDVNSELIIGAQNPVFKGPAFVEEFRWSKGTDRGLTSNFTIPPCSYG